MTTPRHDGSASTQHEAGEQRANPVGAGREMDALIAERVFGWKVERQPANSPWLVCADGTWERVADRRFSSDISAAFLVVEKLMTRHVEVSLHSPHPEAAEWVCTVSAHGYRPFQDQKWHEYADTAPLAICKAALASLGASHVR